MSARDGLGLLPFSDYADDDPNRLPLDEPEQPRETCRDHAHGTWGLGELFDRSCPSRSQS